MIKFNYIRIMLLTAVTASALFLTPVLAYVDLGPEKDLHNYSRTTISTIDSPYEISLQYQIRDAANNLGITSPNKTRSRVTPVT